jgi:hypothetical protein
LAVKSGVLGPAPSVWDARNVWVNDIGYLHLKIAFRDGNWTAAQVNLDQRLGFGTYQVKLIGRPDLFDVNRVLGLFGYTQRDMGPDGTNEIDMEFSRWGNPQALMVCPAAATDCGPPESIAVSNEPMALSRSPANFGFRGRSNHCRVQIHPNVTTQGVRMRVNPGRFPSERTRVLTR